MGVVGILILVGGCACVTGFFLSPDYTKIKVDYFTTNGIIFLVFAIVFLLLFFAFIYFNSIRIDILLAGYDAKRKIYTEILFGGEACQGYEYQRWQANMDAIKANEWLEKTKLWYDNWWNFGISSTVKRRLHKTHPIELKF